jgi:hypothetical protein
LIVALADVGPVGQVDAAIGTVLELHAAEPAISRDEKILGVWSGVSRSLSNQAILVDAPAVRVADEHRVAVFRGPGTAEVDHPAAMGMPAAEFSMDAVSFP